MTAAASAAEARRQGDVAWGRLGWVSWRQHRSALAAFLVLAALIAIAMAATGIVLHPVAARVFSAGSHSPWRLYNVAHTALQLVLLFLPALVGLFIGAPLVAREIETGTAHFAWAQGASRTRQLLASVLPIAVLIAAVASALGLEYRWWLSPFPGSDFAWQPGLFGLNPLPLAGWSVLSFTAGVFLGTAIRRTVPAMAATLAGYVALLYGTSTIWRMHYLPPLRRAFHTHVTLGGGYSYSEYLGSPHRPPPYILSSSLGFPGGRLLSDRQLRHHAPWYSQHHIVLWQTYQPGSRFGLFEVIEFGWLVAASAILIAATVMLIRRRPA